MQIIFCIKMQAKNTPLFFFNQHQLKKGGFGKEYFGNKPFSLVLGSHQMFSFEK